MNFQASNNYYNSLSSSYSYFVSENFFTYIIQIIKINFRRIKNKKVPTGKNKKIKKDFYSKHSKFDKKITEEQLIAKREEFWHTAPAFDGKLGMILAVK